MTARKPPAEVAAKIDAAAEVVAEAEQVAEVLPLIAPPLRRGPELEQTRTGRLYHWQGLTYWSVTSLIEAGLPKPALVPWAAKAVATFAVDRHGFLGQILADEGRDEAIRYASEARYRSSGPKARLGTSVHALAEAYVLGAPYPKPTEQQAPYLASFEAFLADFAPTFVAVEAPCFSKLNRHAGTLDAIVEIDNAELAFTFGVTERRPLRLLVDWKTGSGLYPEIGLQLAAYRYSESFLGLPSADEAPMPEVDGCAGVWLRPDGYSLVPVRADEEIYRSFLFVREVARFAIETSKTVVGREVRPTRRP